MLLQGAKLEWKNILMLRPGAVSEGPQNTTTSGKFEQIILSLPEVFNLNNCVVILLFPYNFFWFYLQTLWAHSTGNSLLCLWLEPERENSVSPSTFSALCGNDTKISVILKNLASSVEAIRTNISFSCFQLFGSIVQSGSFKFVIAKLVQQFLYKSN